LLRHIPLVSEREEEEEEDKGSGYVLDAIVRQTQGFTPADMAKVVRDAVGVAYTRGGGGGGGTSPQAIAASVHLSDLMEAIHKLKPSTLALGPSTTSTTTTTRSSASPTQFTDLSGVEDAIHLLTTAVLLPLKDRGVCITPGGVTIPPPSGILLYGPPGTGKTKMVQALATGI